MPSGEIPLGYRIKAEGADDTIQKLKRLHEEIREGTISAKQYRQEHRELTLAGHAATGEFNDIKGAIAAANPNLLEFTRTMGIFGAVSSTAMSALNTINLAMISGSQATQDLAAAQRQAASDYNDYVRELAAYGPYDPRTQAAYQKWKGDLNEITNLQKQQAIQSVDTAISTIVSVAAIAGSVAQQVTAFQALKEINSRLYGIASGILSWAGPLAIAIAGVYGVYELFRYLFPDAASGLDIIKQKFQDTFHVDPILAEVLSFFTNFGIGMNMIDDAIQNAGIDWVNGWKKDFNVLIDAWDNTVGKITGQVTRLTLDPHIDTTTGLINSINQQLTPAKPNPGAFSPLPWDPSAGPNGNTKTPDDLLSKINLGNDISKNSLSTQIQQAAAIVSQNLKTDQGNNTLNQINSGVAGLLQPLTDQKVAQAQLKDSMTKEIANLKQTIADNINKPQTQMVATHYDSDTGTPIYDSQQLTVAGQAVQSAQQKLDQYQSIIRGLDNATSGLAPVLQSIGLNGDFGIGSVISGALGGAAGIGGAGISAGELQHFAETGDYGVFTAAANRDNATKTPSRQDQIDALLNSWKRSGISGYTAADASKALGYSGVSSGSNNYDPNGGTFGALPGQYGRPSISGPTQQSGKGPPNITTNVTVNAPVLTNQDLKSFINISVKDALQLGGW